MTKKYKYCFLYFMVYLVSVATFTYNKYSDTSCNSGDVIIHAIGSTKAFTDAIGIIDIDIVIDSQTWFGLLLWRDSVKDGLCLSGSEDNNGVCSVDRNKICLQLIELVESSATVDDYKKAIKDYITYASGLSSYQPHFIVTPGSKELTEETYYRAAYYDDQRNNQGFMTYIFGNSNNINTVEYNFDFVISPLMKYSNLFTSALPLLNQRLRVKSIVILEDLSNSEMTKVAISGFESNLNQNNLNILIKRCNSSRSDPYGKNCLYEECANKEQCVLPILDLEGKSMREKSDYIMKWVEVVKEFNPDVFIAATDYNINDIMYAMQILYYTPPIAMTIDKEYAVINAEKTGVYNTNWFYVSQFEKTFEYGKKGKYMGNSEDVYNLVTSKHEDYPDLFQSSDFSDESVFPYNGAAMGITIQRIVEKAAVSATPVDYSDSSNRDDNFKIYQSVIKNFLECSSSSSCSTWETFYGGIDFDNNGINKAKDGVILQIKQDEKSGNKTYEIVAPETIAACNKDKSSCSSTNNYKDCTCKPQYPAEWKWFPREKDDYIKFSSAAGVILTLFNVVLLLLLLLSIFHILRLVSTWEEKYFPFSNIDYIFSSFYFILLSFVSIGKRNSANCFAVRFFQILSSLSLVFTSLSCFYEENDRIHQGTGKHDCFKIEKIVYVFYCIIVSIFITTIPLVNIDITESGTEMIENIIPRFYTKCITLYTLNDFYPFIILSIIIHIYGSFEYQLEPSFYYRGFNYYYIFVNCLYVMFCALYTVKDDILFSALEGTICGFLLIIPFLLLNYIIRPRSPDRLYFHKYKALKVIKNKIRSNINRVFLKEFLGDEKGTKLLEMYGDFHEILKQNEKKSGKMREELKNAFKIKYFSGDDEPEDNYGLSIELYKKLKDRVTDNTFDKKTYSIIKTSLIDILASSHSWERFYSSEKYLNYNNFYSFLHNERKRGIRTLSAIHEQLRVDLIVDKNENPQLFREHCKFYNDALQSRISSVYSSSRRRSTRTASRINPNINTNSEIGLSMRSGANNTNTANNNNTQTANNISAVVNNKMNRNSEFESESFVSSYNGNTSTRKILGGTGGGGNGIPKKPSVANMKNLNNRPSTTNSEFFNPETPKAIGKESMSQVGGDSSSSLIKKESISDSHTDSSNTDESKDEKKKSENKKSDIMSQRSNNKSPKKTISPKQTLSPKQPLSPKDNKSPKQTLSPKESKVNNKTETKETVSKDNSNTKPSEKPNVTKPPLPPN